MLTLSAVQGARQGAGTPGERPAHLPRQTLLGSGLAGTPVLPEAPALLRALPTGLDR